MIFNKLRVRIIFSGGGKFLASTIDGHDSDHRILR